MALALLELIGGLPQSNSRNDDDIADRINHRYTCSMLIMFSVVITTQSYVGETIKCWHPAHFSDPWAEYSNSYCWIKDTYYLPFDDEIPKAHENGKRHRITYYQWLPLILLAQAMLFYLPCMFWRALNDRSGMDVNNVIETAESFNETSKVVEKSGHLSSMTRQFHRYLHNRNREAKKDCVVGCTHLLTSICFVCSRQKGTYLIPLYIFTKMLFFLNVVGQIFALNFFLGMDFSMYGIKWLESLGSGEDFGPAEAFPRVTMCDFIVRRLGNPHRYTMQCVLPINLFNELIYLIIWFWFVFVAGVTAVSAVSWAARSIFPADRHRYVRRHLGLMKHLSRNSDDDAGDHYRDPRHPETPDSADSIALLKRGDRTETALYKAPDPYNWDRETLQGFVDNYLKADGVFIMRLIEHNTNSLTIDEILNTLWQFYEADVKEKPLAMEPL